MLGYGMHHATNPLDDGKATKQSHQMPLDFATNMAVSKQEYTKQTSSTVIQQQQIFTTIQQIQQSIQKLGQQFATVQGKKVG